MAQLVIDSAYAGLPEFAHGGYVAGLLTAALGADSSRVRLRRPVPAARALRLERPDPGHVELHDDAGPLADGLDADVWLDVPEPVSPSEALAASRRFPGAAHHPFPPLPGLRPRAPWRAPRLPRAGERPRGRGRALDTGGAARRRSR